MRAREQPIQQSWSRGCDRILGNGKVTPRQSQGCVHRSPEPSRPSFPGEPFSVRRPLPGDPGTQAAVFALSRFHLAPDTAFPRDKNGLDIKKKKKNSDINAKTLKNSGEEFPGGLGVKDSMLSLLRLRFDSWPRNFCVLQAWPGSGGGGVLGDGEEHSG